jgi:hypothetical protein
MRDTGVGHPRSLSAIRHLTSCSFLQTAQQSVTSSLVGQTASATEEGLEVIHQDVSCDPTPLNSTRRRRNIHKQKFNVLEAVPSGNVIPADAVPYQPPIWCSHQTKHVEAIINRDAGPKTSSNLQTCLLSGQSVAQDARDIT